MSLHAPRTFIQTRYPSPVKPPGKNSATCHAESGIHCLVTLIPVRSATPDLRRTAQYKVSVAAYRHPGGSPEFLDARHEVAEGDYETLGAIREGRDVDPEGSYVNPEPSEMNPDASELNSEAPELNSGASWIGVERSNAPFWRSRIAPGPSEMGPERSGFRSRASEMTPEASELIPDRVEKSPEDSELTPEASELTPEASV